jgi:seryl-tRNA synthetase
MVLSIDLFRQEKGGDPEKMRENQRKRFKDPGLVDIIVAKDEEWRKVRFNMDTFNRLKNMTSKAVGEKMKAKESQGEDATLPETVTKDLVALTAEQLKELTIVQLKELVKLLAQEMETCSAALLAAETARNEALKEMGNMLHESVPVTDNEDFNRVERTFGDCETRKKLTHVDLVEMIDGFDGIRGATVAGSRGYYTKGPVVFLEQAIINLALQQLDNKEYVPLYTPFFMRKDVMQEVAQLSQVSVFRI